MADGSGMRKAGLDGLPCGICLVSMDDEERVLYANRSFLLLMGFSSMEELFSQRGSSFKGLVAEGYVPLGQRCGAEERSGSFYFQLCTSSGSVPVNRMIILLYASFITVRCPAARRHSSSGFSPS